MISRPLGNDIYLSFVVKVSGRPAMLQDAMAKILRNEKAITEVRASVKRNRVSVVIPSDEIKSTGDYTALFDVNLVDMGKQEHAIPFRVTKSALGKKRIIV